MTYYFINQYKDLDASYSSVYGLQAHPSHMNLMGKLHMYNSISIAKSTRFEISDTNIKYYEPKFMIKHHLKTRNTHYKIKL